MPSSHRFTSCKIFRQLPVSGWFALSTYFYYRLFLLDYLFIAAISFPGIVVASRTGGAWQIRNSDDETRTAALCLGNKKCNMLSLITGGIAMKTKINFKLVAATILAAAWALAPTVPAGAQEALRYSCSNQVYEALEAENLMAFSKATGIRVEVQRSASAAALYHLMNGDSDIASVARALIRRHKDLGLQQAGFARDSIAVIAKKECGVQNLTEAQLQGIFSKSIRNWKEVGGNDAPIIVVVPDTETAAHKNFRRLVMREKEIEYDLMTYESTMAIEAVKDLPCGSVSFISLGAAKHCGELTTMKINGYLPKEDGYPFHQTFYYVTKGAPVGGAKKLVDFTRSAGAEELIRKNGLIPVFE